MSTTCFFHKFCSLLHFAEFLFFLFFVVFLLLPFSFQRMSITHSEGYDV